MHRGRGKVLRYVVLSEALVYFISLDVSHPSGSSKGVFPAFHVASRPIAPNEARRAECHVDKLTLKLGVIPKLRCNISQAINSHCTLYLKTTL